MQRNGESFICRGCWDQMHVPIPLRSPLALPFRLVGISRSKMNPNICTICERAFERVQKRRHISAGITILFADIRGYTGLSEQLNTDQLADIVSGFHDNCARGIWAHDGIVNNQMGDGLMAIFNFPIRIEDHAGAAIAAGMDIQRNCKAALAELSETLGDTVGVGLGVGIGIHSGEVEIGNFSSDRSDFTAIGSAVNIAARLESSAAAGEILVSEATANLAPRLLQRAGERVVALKGVAEPMQVRIIEPIS